MLHLSLSFRCPTCGSKMKVAASSHNGHYCPACRTVLVLRDDGLASILPNDGPLIRVPIRRLRRL